MTSKIFFLAQRTYDAWEAKHIEPHEQIQGGVCVELKEYRHEKHQADFKQTQKHQIENEFLQSGNMEMTKLTQHTQTLFEGNPFASAFSISFMFAGILHFLWKKKENFVFTQMANFEQINETLIQEYLQRTFAMVPINNKLFLIVQTPKGKSKKFTSLLFHLVSLQHISWANKIFLVCIDSDPNPKTTSAKNRTQEQNSICVFLSEDLLDYSTDINYLFFCLKRLFDGKKRKSLKHWGQKEHEILVSLVSWEQAFQYIKNWFSDSPNFQNKNQLLSSLVSDQITKKGPKIDFKIEIEDKRNVQKKKLIQDTTTTTITNSSIAATIKTNSMKENKKPHQITETLGEEEHPNIPQLEKVQLNSNDQISNLTYPRNVKTEPQNDCCTNTNTNIHINKDELASINFSLFDDLKHIQNARRQTRSLKNKNPTQESDLALLREAIENFTNQSFKKTWRKELKNCVKSIKRQIFQPNSNFQLPSPTSNLTSNEVSNHDFQTTPPPLIQPYYSIPSPSLATQIPILIEDQDVQSNSKSKPKSKANAHPTGKSIAKSKSKSKSKSKPKTKAKPKTKSKRKNESEAKTLLEENQQEGKESMLLRSIGELKTLCETLYANQPSNKKIQTSPPQLSEPKKQSKRQKLNQNQRKVSTGAEELKPKNKKKRKR